MPGMGGIGLVAIGGLLILANERIGRLRVVDRGIAHFHAPDRSARATRPEAGSAKAPQPDSWIARPAARALPPHRPQGSTDPAPG